MTCIVGIDPGAAYFAWARLDRHGALVDFDTYKFDGTCYLPDLFSCRVVVERMQYDGRTRGAKVESTLRVAEISAWLHYHYDPQGRWPTPRIWARSVPQKVRDARMFETLSLDERDLFNKMNEHERDALGIAKWSYGRDRFLQHAKAVNDAMEREGVL